MCILGPKKTAAGISENSFENLPSFQVNIFGATLVFDQRKWVGQVKLGETILLKQELSNLVTEQRRNCSMKQRHQTCREREREREKLDVVLVIINYDCATALP